MRLSTRQAYECLTEIRKNYLRYTPPDGLFMKCAIKAAEKCNAEPYIIEGIRNEMRYLLDQTVYADEVEI